MQIIDIVPIHYLHLVQNQPMAMFLTHLVENSPEYAKFARNYTGYKILDNSLIELGEAVSIERVLNAAKTIKADEIILEDVFGKGPETIDAVNSNIEDYKGYKWDESIIGCKKPKLMAVAQGRDAREFRKCFNALCAIPEISTIGIPKRCAKLHPQGRPFFERLWTGANNNVKKDIHLLGLWYSYEELYRYQYPDRIRSVDTCLASFHASHMNSTLFNPWAVRPDGYTIDLEDTFNWLDIDLFYRISDYHKKTLREGSEWKWQL